MPDPVPLRYHVDQPVSWRPATPDLEITGWAYAAAGDECRDVRAWVDGRVFYGLHGLDRPDIESATSDGLAARRSGFIQRVRLWFGAANLVLEWAGVDGTWREFFRTALDTRDLPGGLPPVPILRGNVVYQSLAHLYRHHHRQAWREVRAAADRILQDLLAAATDVTADSRYAGCIENPGFWVDTDYDKFRVTGWTYRTGGEPVTQLVATTTSVAENRLIHGKDRPDVAAHRPQEAAAAGSGFYGLVDVPPTAPSPLHLKIFEVRENGSREIVFARRIHVDRRSHHEGPAPVYAATYFWKCAAALLRGRFLGRYTFDSASYVWKEIRRLQADLADGFPRQGAHDGTPPPEAALRHADPYTRWVHANRLSPRLLDDLARDAAIAAEDGPLLTVVVPAYNTPERHLRELLESLDRQLYRRWELCIADDASPQPHVREMLEAAARRDARIKPVYRSQNGHISRATNSAMELAGGDFLAFLDHDDVLPPDALLHVAEAIRRHPEAGYLYTDEDKIDDNGRRYDPQFKGGWSPEMAITHNFTHHLTVIRRSLVEKVGRLRPEFDGSQDLDLFLRCFERLRPAQVIHVPFICYHWRAHAESTATRGDQKTYLFEAARGAITAALERRGLRAAPHLPPFAATHALCLHQLRWDARLLAKNPVTIVIPNRNRADLLGRCLDSLAATVPPHTTDIVVVDDESDDPATLAFLDQLPRRADLRCRVIRARRGKDGFNYARLVNLGSAVAETPLLLHLNNDVTAHAPGWLEDLVGWLSISEVGVVGPRLLDPDGRINHAGLSIGRNDGLPHTLFAGLPAGELGYLFLPHAARNVTAVTGACLLTRTELYWELEGFDEQGFGVAYNDVDYCRRVQDRGLRVVYSPQAELTHIGSASRGSRYAVEEHVAYLSRHGSCRDPYLSEALRFPPAVPELDPHHNPYSKRGRGFQALIVTHALDLSGGPLIALELAEHLARQPGMHVSVASGQDGPLRGRFEEAGLPVRLVDVTPLLRAGTRAEFDAALARLATEGGWHEIELVIANTAMAFWSVHLARRLGCPSVFYVQESSPMPRLLAAHVSGFVVRQAEQALALATRAVFAAQASRNVFEPHNREDNFRTLPGWIDVAAIERFAAGHDRAALRRKHGLDPAAIIVLNLGSVCERKGQHVFVRAIDLLRTDLAAVAGAPPVHFLMVGGRGDFYEETVRQDIALLGLKNVTILPASPEPYDFQHLADVLVCTSFEESFPRVLLEAMAFRTRIVSTDVHGIPEMLINLVDAHLVPAGDAHKLRSALRRALDEHATGDHRMVDRAAARVRHSFAADRTLPRHVSLCREAFYAAAPDR